VAQAVNEIAPLKVVMGERRAGDPAELIASNDKAKRILGWSPKYKLSDIVRTDYNYRKKISHK
ncbi:MAG TPA: hypothetical protein DHV05_05660, partial [Acholeplasmataceae bacterium]|nr:hypothetical protein [Acholeplasmataceae bacterium]